MNRIVLNLSTLISLFFVFYMEPAQSGGNELIEKFRNRNLSEELQSEKLQEAIIRHEILIVEDGMDFFLSEHIEDIPKAVQKKVFKRIISVNEVEVLMWGNIRPKERYSLPQNRRQMVDRMIPLVDFAIEAAHVFRWDREPGLILNSPMTESQMRKLVKRGRIRDLEEGVKLLASRPLNFPADELSGIVADIVPHINSFDDGVYIFSAFSATSFEERPSNLRETPVGEEAKKAYNLPNTLIMDIVDKMGYYVGKAEVTRYPERRAIGVMDFLSTMNRKHPRYPFIVVHDGALLVSFEGYVGTIRNLSSDEQRGKFIRRLAPLIKHANVVRRILRYKQGFYFKPEAFFFGDRTKFYDLFSEEDMRYFIDNTVHLFDSPEELKELSLNRKELRYARKAMQNREPKKTKRASIGNLLVRCVESWRPMQIKK